MPPPWQTKDDRIRGGASQSYLTAIEGTTSARFHGRLDTSTLGGAGFASQFSPEDAPPPQTAPHAEKQPATDWFWALASYDGIELVMGESNDGKEYTFILRDEKEQEKRSDGRGKAGISWEVKFKPADCNIRAGDSCRYMTLPWQRFRATYRGKEVESPAKLKTDEIRRIGFMMRR